MASSSQLAQPSIKIRNSRQMVYVWYFFWLESQCSHAVRSRWPRNTDCKTNFYLIVLKSDSMENAIFMTTFKFFLLPLFETIAWLLAIAILPTLSLQISYTTNNTFEICWEGGSCLLKIQ